MNSRLTDTEEHISNLEDRIMEIIQSEHQKGQQKSNSRNKYLWEHCILTFALYYFQKDEKNGNVFEEIMLKLQKPEKGNRYPSIGSTEGLKQIGPH